MSRIVCKFGGTSVASAAQIEKVRRIVDGDPRRSVIIVSAPGKRQPDEAKITDLLYLCHEMAGMHADFASTFAEMRDRFLGIERELGVKGALDEQLGAFRKELEAGCSTDYAASRGEFFCASLIADYLRAEFVDPKDYVKLTASGNVDPSSYQALGTRLSDANKRYVIPGFYGSDAHGQIKTFSRGGSDISGAVAARAIRADLYENWTDVSGLLMADPRIVKNPRPMAEVTYRELRELSYLGATVLHDEATLPCREAGIPIQIRNTNEPDHPGTRIVARLSREVEAASEIAGIAGKKTFSMVCVEKSLMNKEVGFAHRLLGVFERRGISFEHCPSSIDGINVILEKQQLGDAAEEIIDEIRRLLLPDKVTLERDVALVAVVGEGMSHTIGMAAKVFSALKEARVNVRVINQGASEVNIIVGVAPADFERSVEALYGAFVG